MVCFTFCYLVILKTDGSSDSTYFRGYLIQARSGNSTTSIGTFVTNGQINKGKLMSCPGGTAVCFKRNYVY